MKRSFLLPLFLVLSLCAQAQFSHWERSYSYPLYKIALTFSNPFGAATKAGSGLERRNGNWSSMLSYYRYWGAYPGEKYDYDFRVYGRKVYRHVTKTNWYYQGFVYSRLFVGTAAFDSDPLEFMGYRTGVYWYEKLYTGGSFGFGRRYFTRHFFATVQAGARAATFSLDPVEPEARQHYRLFYSSGPGSIFELNFQFGIQL